MGNSRTRTFAAAASVLAVSALAFAHGDDEDGVDLGPAIARVDAALTTAEGSAAKVYGKIRKKLGAHDEPGVADDLGRIKKARKLAGKLSPADEELRAALGVAVEAADGVLATVEPDNLADLVQQISRANDRGKVERAGLAAVSERDLGRGALDTGDVDTAVKRLSKSAKRFVGAAKLARKLIKRQGGGLPQFKAASPRTAYTVVGNGEGGHNGEDRAARRSSLYFPIDATLGPDGLLYVVDWNNHRIRVRTPDGHLERVCGSGTPGDTEGGAESTDLNHPSQVVFDSAGRMFMAAWHNHKVKVFDGSGDTPDVYTVAGGPAGNSTQEGLSGTAARFNLVPGILLLPTGHPLGSGDLLLTDASNARVLCVRIGSAPVEDTNVAGVTVDTGRCDQVFGTGVPGYSGDGLQASLAQFEFSRTQNAYPDGRMAIDSAGNVYVVMGVHHVVRKIAPDGTVTTFAGNGTAGYSGDGDAATSAQLDLPADVVAMPDGSVCISDSGNHVIRRVAPDGTISTWAGKAGVRGYSGDDGPATDATFDHPSGLEVDADGNLYVADRGNNVIRVVTSDAPGAVQLPVDPYELPVTGAGGPPAPGPTGTIDTFAGSGTLGFNGNGRPALETDFYWPQDVGIEPITGLVHLLDWNNHRVRRIEADGTVTTVVGSGELGDDTGDGTSVPLNHPTDLAFDPLTGELWIAAWHTDKILRLDGNTQEIVYAAGGKRAFSGDGGPASAAQLNLPSSVKFDAAGNWYVADKGNRRIRFVSRASGFISTFAGTGEATDPTHPLGDGGPALQATFNLPLGQAAQPAGRICLDPSDTYVYIADTDNGRVRRIHIESGIITTVAGNGTRHGPGESRGDGGQAAAASLLAPVDVDCDAAGNLYISDRDDDCIRRVDITTGVITTIAGGNGNGYSGDGGQAANAKLDRPGGLFVDRSTGRVYVADTYNGVIRVIWE